MRLVSNERKWSSMRAKFRVRVFVFVLLTGACGNVTPALVDAPPSEDANTDGPPVMDAPGADAAIDSAMIDGPPAQAQLAIDRTTADLGSVVVGQTSAAAMFTITNTGTADSGNVQASVVGAGYAIANNLCIGSLAPSASCQVGATVTPTAPGTPTGTLAVSAAPGGIVTAALSATALAPSALTATPASGSFGQVEVGVLSAT